MINPSYPAVILERDTCFVRIGRFHEDQLVLPHFIQDTLRATCQEERKNATYTRQDVTGRKQRTGRLTISFHAATILSI